MATHKGESFVWTDSEVELLLNLTNAYKSDKIQESVDYSVQVHGYLGSLHCALP